MKEGYSVLFLALLLGSVACADRRSKDVSPESSKSNIAVVKVSAKDTFETGKIISNIICKSDTTHSYALYIPGKNKEKTLPVIYFFDPHGDGSFPLSKYKPVADKFGFILIGSNNSKNGIDWTTNEYIWTTMFNDTQKRLPIIAGRVYTCGFSGGAKVATYIALHHSEIKGVIANGAGLPEITAAGNVAFSFTALAGEGDMNMTDLVAITKALDQTQIKHRIIFFNGIHEWARVSIMNTAFAGLQFDAMRRKEIPKDDAFISNYIVSSKKEIADYVQTKDFIKADRECILSAHMLDGLSDEVKWFTGKEALLKNSAVYQRQSQAAEILLKEETRIKEVYNQQFEAGDESYWNKTITDVQFKSKASGAEGGMYKRLHAYLSLAFYSISNRLINLKQNVVAKHFVDLYKLSDPGNSEAWYFSAILNARSKNVNAVQNDLKKAVASGFADKLRMMQQAEFQIPELEMILKEIKNGMR